MSVAQFTITPAQQRLIDECKKIRYVYRHTEDWMIDHGTDEYYNLIPLVCRAVSALDAGDFAAMEGAAAEWRAKSAIDRRVLMAAANRCYDRREAEKKDAPTPIRSAVRPVPGADLREQYRAKWRPAALRMMIQRPIGHPEGTAHHAAVLQPCVSASECPTALPTNVVLLESFRARRTASHTD